jgi:hypothetical protein
MLTFEWLKRWLDVEPLTVNETITLTIALWGAFLSTYNLLADRPRIKVKRELLPIIADDGTDPIKLRAINVGKPPVTLEMLRARRADRDQLLFAISDAEQRKLPKKLDKGETLSICIDLNRIRDDLGADGLSGKVVLRPYFLDAVGKKYWGDKVVVKGVKSKWRTKAHT